MVAKKGLQGKAVGKLAREEAVATFLTSMSLDGSRSLKELGRPPTAFEIRVYEVDTPIDPLHIRDEPNFASVFIW